MNCYEILNYFDRARYFATSANDGELLEMVDAKLVEKLQGVKNGAPGAQIILTKHYNS